MIHETIAAIQPLDEEAMAICQTRLDNLTKPIGSLHGLEILAAKMAGITRLARPNHLKKAIILMAADHGVAVENVSAFPQDVTRQMVFNIANGGAAINVFARHAEADLVLVDIGVATDLPDLPGLRKEKVAFGTNNIALGPAMARKEALQAVEIGIRVAKEQTDKGITVIGLGEMGIANTTPSTAIITAYSGIAAEKLVGQGTGICRDALEHKAQIITKALRVNAPDINDPIDVLTKVGGLEIAGLVGVILGAAAGRAAVVIDGVIASAAALVAVRIAPQVRDFLVGSHFSVEPAHQKALELIDIPAYLYLEMRLGEGTGAALGLTLIDAALHVLNDMKTFGEAAVAVAEDGLGAGKQRTDVC